MFGSQHRLEECLVLTVNDGEDNGGEKEGVACCSGKETRSSWKGDLGARSGVSVCGHCQLTGENPS